MVSIRVFTLTDTLRRHSFRRRETPKCWKCGKPIEVGEQAVLKAGKHWRLYHKGCWDGMFY